MEYTITREDTVELTVEPRVYNLDVIVKYNGSEYYLTDGDRFEDIKNLNGTQIFTSNPAEAELDKGIEIKLQNAYFYGDVVEISYQLNQDLYDEANRRWMYTVNVEIDGVSHEQEGMTAEYSTVFTGTDKRIVIEVLPYKEGVVIKANSNKKVGQIYASVNGGELQSILLQGTNIGLEVGETLELYIQEGVGFRFSGTYAYSKEAIGIYHEVDTVWEELDGEWYIRVEMFEGGFQIGNDGTYTLQFEQIPIRIEYKYYEVTPEIKEAPSGEGYTEVYEGEIIEEGSLVKLIKGTDPEGYRFMYYTYKGAEGLGGVRIVGDELEITEEIIESLRGVEEVEGYLPLNIYVNYIKQYMVEVEYECERRAVEVELKVGEEVVTPGRYYDYGTELKVSVKAKDSKHYQVKVTIDGEDATGTAESVTNKGNVSGIRINKHITKACKIVVGLEAEEYGILLKQKTQGIEGEQEEESYTLEEASTWFDLGTNIQYQAEGTFRYGTEVKVEIKVQSPTGTEGAFYEVKEVRVNGMLAVVTTESCEDGMKYTITYKLEGEDLPLLSEIEVSALAMCYVKLELSVN